MVSVTYNRNGSTSGSVPVDTTTYNPGDSVTVLGNTGGLVKNSDQFAYWNTAADGTGSVPGGTFTIGASDVTLFAQWYTTSGLNGGGTTAHYQFQFDSVLTAGGLEPTRTNALIAKVEADFDIMKGWFAGIELPYAYPVAVNVANLGGGASWGPPITLKGGSGGVDYLRDLLVAEVTEMFMLAQGGGWFAPDGTNEQSSGEGLSHFLNQQFEIGDGRPAGLAFNADRWLNSSLPTSDPSSSRFGPAPGNYDYGARFDYVNNILEYDHSNSPASGCSVLFLWYLFAQLGYSTSQIVQAAAPTIGAVYRNLTGDNVDPFPFFKLLLDNAYPPTSASAIPGPDRDNPFPLALVSFWVDKNTFGKDEVLDVQATHAGRFPNAFWLVIEGLSANQFNALGVSVPAFTGAFAGAATITRSALPIDFEDPSRPDRQQRIRIAYDITFSSSALTSFPDAGEDPILLELDGRITINGSTPPNASAATIFELTAGADPYFTNIDPAQNNVFWLSQDLRVFTATPGQDDTPVNGGPAFGGDSPAGAFTYVTQLIDHLNATYADPEGVDPFDSLLPGQSGALSGDSSVSPVRVVYSFPTFNVYNNYNFAVARVRLRGLSGDVANNVKVFFRLWASQTADTDFQPTTTYLSTQAGGRPTAPLVGTGNRTIPFFATGNLGANTDYVAGGANNQDIHLDIGDSRWTYFGCFLNVYDQNNLVGGQPVQALLAGTHHCLVAEIACDTAPILNSSTITMSPENSDHLAQRNLQVTASDNPGGAASHRIPQAFDVRASEPLVDLPGSLLNYPDELMIDWGKTPIGSTAHIYWPQVAAADVLALAASLYSHHPLSASDPHTIECPVTGGVTYVPIPPGTGESFAGLLTIDLPTTVTAGEEFDVVVRRVSTRRSTSPTRELDRAPSVRTETDVPPVHIDEDPDERPELGTPARLEQFQSRKIRNWRFVTGTFQVKIPVGTPATLLGPELSTLAIFKWRLQQMSPANRWFPVVQRYLLYLGARVVDMGGNPDEIPASPLGYWKADPSSEPGSGEHGGREHNGRIVEIVYDCHGRMEGFVLRECCEDEHVFRACDRDLEEIVLKACTARYRVSVLTGAHDPALVHRLVVRG